MLQGVILDLESLGPSDLDLTAIKTLAVKWIDYPTTTAQQVAERIRHADVVITNKAPIGEAELLMASNLKLIAVIATGVNVIDLQATQAKGVGVCHCVNYGTASVAQHTFSLILALTTRLMDYQRSATNGHWANSPFFCVLDYPVHELAGKTLGIIGYGKLGQKVAAIAQAFDMTVKVAQLPNRNSTAGGVVRTPLPQLLPQVDILTLHCPLTAATDNLIGHAELAAMKKTALLINTARGGIVNEAALAKALEKGQLGGAGIDVLSQEPPRQGNPLLNPKLSNLIVTPHSAWLSREARQRLIDQTADNICQFFSGSAQNMV